MAVAVQRHPLDSESQKIWAYLPNFGGNVLMKLEGELKQPGLSTEQRRYILNLMTDYCNRAIMGSSAFLTFGLGLLSNRIITHINSTENQNSMELAEIGVYCALPLASLIVRMRLKNAILGGRYDA